MLMPRCEWDMIIGSSWEEARLATVNTPGTQMASRAMLMRLRTLSRSVTLTAWRSLVTCDNDDMLTAGLTYVIVVSRGALADTWNSLAPVSSRIRRRFRSVIPPATADHRTQLQHTEQTPMTHLYSWH